MRVYFSISPEELKQQGWKRVGMTFFDKYVGGQFFQLRTTDFGEITNPYLDFQLSNDSPAIFPVAVQGLLLELKRGARFSMLVPVAAGWRKPGVYRFRSARMTLGTRQQKTALVGSENIEDVLLLADRFNRGVILPSSDYDQPQIERPIRTLRQISRELWELFLDWLATKRWQMDNYASRRD